MGVMQELITKVNKKQIKPNITVPQTGDYVKVSVKIVEGEKERIQMFEGLVIKTQGTGSTFAIVVRKDSFGVGVERTFKIHSPSISDVVVTKSGRVRRARIYYMRDRKGKSARLKEIKRK